MMVANMSYEMIENRSWGPEHAPWNPNEYSWAKLEDVLSCYLKLIDQKRILPFEDPPEITGDQWHLEDAIICKEPWLVMDDDEPIVQLTISAWNDLLEAIESRLPPPDKTAKPIVHEHKTYIKNSIKACKVEGKFLDKFIERARLLAFQYIAPGLRLARDEELSSQPFRDVDLTDLFRAYHYDFYPFLFLRAD
jgi:hypothetical protein